MNRPLQAALSKLRNNKNGCLTGSSLTQSQRRALEDFGRQTGAVNWMPKGRGIMYQSQQPEVIEQHWQQLTPYDKAAADKNLPARATNIAKTRNSKSGQHQHEYYYLPLKAKGSVSWHNDNGYLLDLQEATKQMGAATLKISAKEDIGWQSKSPLWLIENQALFDHLDWLPEQQACSVLYYSGHLQNLLINWLARHRRANKIYFFPDYDGVGLKNYARLKHKLNMPVEFWLIPNWKNLLLKTGSNELWKNTNREFKSALPDIKSLCSDEPELIELLETMQINGLALEQEAVWLNSQT